MAGTAPRLASMRFVASASELAAASLRSALRTRRLAAHSSILFAIHTVHVMTEAIARPIITDFTTMSAAMNMLHGDRSRGRLWACTMGAGEVVATGAAAGVPGAVTSLTAGAADSAGGAVGWVGAGLAAVSGVVGVGEAVADGVAAGETAGAIGGVVAAGAADDGAFGGADWSAAGGAVVGAGCVLS
jgi:hypothetical protein